MPDTSKYLPQHSSSPSSQLVLDETSCVCYPAVYYPAVYYLAVYYLYLGEPVWLRWYKYNFIVPPKPTFPT